MEMVMTELRDDPRFPAAVDVLRRTGPLEFQVRYADDELPVVWICVARYNLGRDGRPQRAKVKGTTAYEVGAGLSPIAALFKLCDQVLDHGTCAHCGRPTGFAGDATTEPGDGRCWWTWDASSSSFVRGCEAGVNSV
jgi:hypothetical protein